MENTLKNWLSNWHNKQYRAMLTDSQISWVNADYIVKGIPQDVGLYIRDLYKQTDLLDYEILTQHPVKYGEETLDERVIVDYTVACRINYKGLLITKDEVRLIRIVQETKDGKPTAKGKWGVNPISALRKIDHNFSNAKKGVSSFADLVPKMKAITDSMDGFKTKENRTK